MVCVVVWTAASSAAEVRLPTVPLAGFRLLATWKRLTACLVTASKWPVTGTT